MRFWQVLRIWANPIEIYPTPAAVHSKNGKLQASYLKYLSQTIFVIWRLSENGRPAREPLLAMSDIHLSYSLVVVFFRDSLLPLFPHAVMDNALIMIIIFTQDIGKPVSIFDHLGMLVF